MFLKFKGGNITSITKMNGIVIDDFLDEYSVRMIRVDQPSEDHIEIYEGSQEDCRKVTEFIWQQIKLGRSTADLDRFVRKMNNKKGEINNEK